jgi:hypothetical protein
MNSLREWAVKSARKRCVDTIAFEKLSNLKSHHIILKLLRKAELNNKYTFRRSLTLMRSS